MKKLLTYVALAATCLTASADPIDEVKAKSIAQEYLIPGHSMSLVVKAQRTPSKVKKINAATAATSPYYIYSRGEGQGYVIVAGDDCIPSIIGYTESGDFDASNLPPALQDMLDYYAAAVENAQVNGTNAPKRYNAPMRAAADRKDIKPLTTSHWHQSGPYNDICPNRVDNGAKAMVGCVATAASQILYYWRKDLPSTLQSTTPTYSYGNAHPSVSFPKGTPVKWDLMCDKYGSEPQEYKTAVAEFCYCVGTATWLTYADGTGTATSGNIEKIPNTFSSFFGMNGGSVRYRDSYSQENWTQLIYDELIKGRPVMYTGQSASQGGHAVYIDGYQKTNDLMHFNFGWGGQGDGYYTTDQEKGMNGFNGSQSCLVGAFPKKWNMSSSINSPAHVYANIENEFTISIENNSTLSFCGAYIFASTSSAKPTAIKNAKSSNTTIVIPVGGKASFKLTAKPTSERTWYFTITDENLNILAQKAIDVEIPKAEVATGLLTANGSSDSEKLGDTPVTVFYNSKATLQLNTINNSDVAWGGTAKIDIYCSSDNGQTFNFSNTVTKPNCVVPAYGSAIIEFSSSSLKADSIYYAEVNNVWAIGSVKDTIDGSKSPRVYFKITGESDLTATLDKQTGMLTFAGHWDPAQYAGIVARTTNKTALSYDLTEVKSISVVPDAEYPNPNALIYAPEGASGTNVIAAGVCKSLAITAGYDFAPKAAFKAQCASININATPNAWSLITVPFSCTCPDGIIARDINSHKTTSTGISGATTNVRDLIAGHTYIVMAASEATQTLSANASSATIDIISSPATNTDAALIGTLAATTVPAGAKVIADKSEDQQYFMTAAEGTQAEALRGYFLDALMPDSKTDFRAYSSLTLDPSYIILGRSIQNLHATYTEACTIVTAEANAQMLDSIARAEKVFTEQSILSQSAVKNYAKALDAFAQEYNNMIGDAGNATIDMTSAITNPSFETSTSMPKGWTVEGKSAIRQNSALAYKTVYGDGANYISLTEAGSISQTLTNLTPGYYRLTAKAGATTDEDPVVITVFAADSTASITAHPFGKHYLSEACVDSVLVKDGTLTIGARADGKCNIDDFRLTFITNWVDPAGIEDIPVANTDDKFKAGIYTLQGTRINNISAPGTYIINGKKYLIKK